MTQDERKQIRDTKLLNYLDAVDDRKANCGRLSEIIGAFRRIVNLYDESALPPTLLDGSLRLPSSDDLADALKACLKAKQFEHKQYEEAINAGVDPSRMKQPETDAKPPAGMPFV